MNTMTLHNLPKVGVRSRKRQGRGYGSGKGGHTSGRGQKGQRSRRTIPWSFEGGALPLSRRLPFWRGKGRLNPLKPKNVVLNISQLERFPNGTVIDLAFLVKERIIHQDEADARGVKVLGDGKFTKKLTIVGLRVSLPAKAKIEKAGGVVSDLAPKAPVVPSEKKKLVEEKKSEKVTPKVLKVSNTSKRTVTKKRTALKKTPNPKKK